MAQAIRKFVPRAPRYVLRPHDDSFFRFAFNHDKKHTYTTKFLNVSESGLLFVVDRELIPELGDIIKVEFTAPGGEPLAWWARVVRVEEYDRTKWWLQEKDFDNLSQVLVGVQFQDMPEGHQNTIRKGLEDKFLEVTRQRRKESFQAFLDFVADNFWKFFIYLFCIIFTFSLLYFLSQPTENYSAERGAPWGERF